LKSRKLETINRRVSHTQTYINP